MIKRVELLVSTKELKKLPQHVLDKLLAWVLSVEKDGIEQVRMRPGYHDEPLRGRRSGQRSIRLNKAYRAIYRIGRDGDVELVEVIEAHKHRY